MVMNMLIVSLLKVWTQFEKNKHVGYKTPKSSKNNIFASSYPPQQFIIIIRVFFFLSQTENIISGVC